MDSEPPQLVVSWALALLPALLAAIFAAASFAVGSLSEARRSALLQSLVGPRRAALERYVAHGRTIEARWLVLRVIGIALTACLAALLVDGLETGWRVLTSLLTAVVAYGVPAEIARAIVQRGPEAAAPTLLRVLRPLEVVAAPIAAPISMIGRLARSRTPSLAPTPGITETEVEIIVTQGEQDGSLAADQSEMIRNVLDFGDVIAGDVTVPRTRVRAIELHTPAEEAMRFVDECGHSRYPVYRDRIDNVVGILHVKDLLSYAAAKDLAKLDLDSIIRKPVAFVPESQSASSVLKDMRAGRHHMAVVIDEYGGMSGILTLEDLVEKIVGDIRDEHDAQGPPVRKLAEGHLLVDASVSVASLSRALDVEIPESDDYHSLGGFLVSEMGRVPKPGARLKALGLEFLVREADERHVASVEIFLSPEKNAPDSAPVQTPPSSSTISAA